MTAEPYLTYAIGPKGKLVHVSCLFFMYSCLVTHDKAYFFKLSICSLVKPVACMICR